MNNFFAPLDLNPYPKPEQPVPITILTGFLGSGKTTLLNKLLHGDHGLKMAVLVNDFGDINIDSQMIVGVEGENLISLENGCVCCTIRGDLLDSVLALFQIEQPPDYIVIEASGVSYPAEVARTFLLPELSPYLRIDSILALIDTEQVLSLGGEAAVLATDQVSMADIVVLNKLDLTTVEQVEAVKTWVLQIIPFARILEAKHADVPLEFVLDVGLNSGQDFEDLTPGEVHVHTIGAEDPGHAEHSKLFYTWSYQSQSPLAFKAVRGVIQTLPPNIIRAKGIMYLNEVDQRGIFQLAGKRVSLHLGKPWGERQPKTQLVFISVSADIDVMDLELRFESCLAQHVSPEEKDVTITEIEDWIRTQ